MSSTAKRKKDILLKEPDQKHEKTKAAARKKVRDKRKTQNQDSMKVKKDALY